MFVLAYVVILSHVLDEVADRIPHGNATTINDLSEYWVQIVTEALEEP